VRFANQLCGSLFPTNVITFPPLHFESILTLSPLFDSTWHQRRIVLTKGIQVGTSIKLNYLSKSFRAEVIFFAHLKDDIIIDKIPMNEVELVREMGNIIHENKKSSDAAELMIETHPDGYNSGRIYYLQAESKAMCQKIIQKLKQYCTAARERANARTAMAQAQQHVRKLYRSKPFQNIVAFLIIAVCYKNKNLVSLFYSALMLACSPEFRGLRSRRTIQTRWYNDLRPFRFQFELCLHGDLRNRARRQHVCKPAPQVCAQRLELARPVRRRDVHRGLWAVRHPGLVGPADARLPNRAALRAGARADQDVLRHHRLPLPDDERLRHHDHRAEHL
jgi:hypothetical protein